MIIAGSLLALLLMGLALDGFVNPIEKETDEDETDEAAGEAASDLSDDVDGLADLLDAHADTVEMEAEPQDALQSDAPGAAEVELTPDESEAFEVQEARADSAWAEAAQPDAARHYIEVDAMIETDSGETVSYVDSFDTETDALVLEFDGDAADAPDIDTVHDPKRNATLVLANGLPVSMVAGTEGLSPDHIRIVMQDAAPQTLPASDAQPEPATPPRDPGSDGPLTQMQNPDPAQAADQTDADLDAVLDQVASEMSGPGGIEEMLTARATIDDIFDTGGDDAITGTLNDDHLTGTASTDALFGDEGDDTLTAGQGNDELHGDTGDDNLQGGGGIDFLTGGDGHDTLDGGGDRDLLFGGDGDDVLHGGGANDFLQGGTGADTLNGGSGDDLLDGTFGDGSTDQDRGDVLLGGSGDDQIILGQGDTAIGGTGADTFTGGSYIESAEVAGHVNDFNPAEDRIEVIFDPELNPDPTIEVQDFADGRGANILLNGEIILSVAGAQGLDPNMIELQAVA
ncbi:calcium-binding protein [Gymnodinialimonas ceratoperidinii]|uniref:Uncharacterized protein n=1 Tax=Gymnodinialimonas ceratoperidinii TaxID=2856823 RepID=A0A8F6YB49_9RHOB|nr:calcium-binding protein [Gymnodinialimonas ceratoperidinii]QXT40193.1 hypothetical protein KYE46_02740 [Gymnodinialimonas ceratoperidinii]